MNLHERNRDIVSRLRAGEKVKDLAVAYNLSDASIRLINKQIVKKQNQTPHWSDNLSTRSRNIILAWGKRKRLAKDNITELVVTETILNGTFRHRTLGEKTFEEIANYLKIDYTTAKT